MSYLKVAVYPGNVLALHMSKPHGFRYKSGKYMFINCVAVSPFEWYYEYEMLHLIPSIFLFLLTKHKIPALLNIVYAFIGILFP
jgi:hypothetical protein